MRVLFGRCSLPAVVAKNTEEVGEKNRVRVFTSVAPTGDPEMKGDHLLKPWLNMDQGNKVKGCQRVDSLWYSSG